MKLEKSGEKMSKIIYFDVETTGLDFEKNEIIQFAGIIEIDGKTREELEFKMRPDNYKSISNKSLEITGLTVEDIKKFPFSQEEGYKKILALFDKYIDKFDKKDRFIYAGHSVIHFDFEFLNRLFLKYDNPYLRSYLGDPLDSFQLVRILRVLGILNVQRLKLEDLCSHFKIDIEAHDALEDIRANRKLIKHLTRGFKKVKIGDKYRD